MIVSAIGGVSLVALIAFGLWRFRPFRSDSEDVSVLDEPDERR